MFTESLLESAIATDKRRGWTTALSLSLQALLLLALVSTSLVRPADLVFIARMPPLPLIVPRITPVVVADRRAESHTPDRGAAIYVPSPAHDVLHFGAAREQSEAPPPLFPNASLTRGGAVGNPLAIAISPSGRGPAGPTPAIRLRLSYLEPGQLLSGPQPQYPALARQAGIQGRVVLTAIIG